MEHGSLAGLLLLGSTAHAGTPAAKADAFLTHKMVAPVQSDWASVVVKLDGNHSHARQARLAAPCARVTRPLHFLHAAAWQAPYSATGAGVAVGVVDSGVNPGATDLQVASGTPSLPGPPKPVTVPGGPVPSKLAPGPGGNRVRYSVSFVSPDKSTTPDTTGDVNDQCGHGTHVAGIVAGNGKASTGSQYTQTFLGVAPQAQIINVRVLNAQGGGTVSTVLAGLQWVYYNARNYNIRVVNLSVGHPVGESYTTDPLCQAAEALWQAGVVVVCAAGNDGRVNGNAYAAGLDNEGYGVNYGSINSPGNDPYVITVGAMKQMDASRADDRIATYSSRGPSLGDNILKPDIVAPGNRVISLDVNNSYLDLYGKGTNRIPQSTYMNVKPGTTTTSDLYFRLSGTSMATPVVSAAAALLLQADPTLTADTVKARLMLSADKWASPDGTGAPCTFGAGYLDIPAALACTAVTQGPALSPALGMDGQGTLYLDMSRAMWGNSLWGTGVTDTRAMWGNDALYGNTSVDPSNALWGKSMLAASHAIWGNNALWGSRAMWGTFTEAADLSTNTIYGEADISGN